MRNPSWLLLIPLFLSPLAVAAPKKAKPSEAASTPKKPVPRNLETDLPKDPKLAEVIKQGAKIFNETKAFAGKYAGNNLSCTNCHRNSGQHETSIGLNGVAALYPQYASRADKVITLEQRIRACFMRSLNGTPPPFDSPEMIALMAYLGWISEGYPVGVSPPWRHFSNHYFYQPENKSKVIPVAKLDQNRGKVVFEKVCANCHGPDGQGVGTGDAAILPLWGPRSFNEGAAMTRIYTLAGFVRHNMPCTITPELMKASGKTQGELSISTPLTDEDAQHVAAYVLSHDRPTWPAANKAKEFPLGVPDDAIFFLPTNPLKPAGAGPTPAPAAAPAAKPAAAPAAKPAAPAPAK